ncbi:unnamed protein product, partial [Tetraodon nigroviridis]
SPRRLSVRPSGTQSFFKRWLLSLARRGRDEQIERREVEGCWRQRWL